MVPGGKSRISRSFSLSAAAFLDAAIVMICSVSHSNSCEYLQYVENIPKSAGDATCMSLVTQVTAVVICYDYIFLESVICLHIACAVSNEAGAKTGKKLVRKVAYDQGVT